MQVLPTLAKNPFNKIIAVAAGVAWLAGPTMSLTQVTQGDQVLVLAKAQ